MTTLFAKLRSLGPDEQRAALAKLPAATRLALMSPEHRAQLLGQMTDDDRAALQYHWPLWARPDQLPPQGTWTRWLLLSGRGSGKSRALCEWVRYAIESGQRRRIALCSPTHLHGRKVLVEGSSGLLACCPPWAQPTYEVTLNQLTWPNGGVVDLISAETPERARGPSYDAAAFDELCYFQDAQEFWDTVAFSLRLRGPTGLHPRVAIATTPRNIPLLHAIIRDPGTVTTRASTFDNLPNLSPEYVATLQQRYGGTSLGRQELMGELLTDLDGALWRRVWIDVARVSARRPSADSSLP